MSFNQFYTDALKEKKLGIQRFDGVNKISDSDVLKFLHSLQTIASNGSVDLNTNDKVSMIEKLDGIPTNWGHNPEFFMESAGTGEITSESVEKLNTENTKDLYEAFKFLDDYTPFHDRLHEAENYAGAPIKFISEMIPVLTHSCDDMGNFIFCSTKYNKSKFGNKGAFVISDVKIKEGESWVEPSEDIKDMLVDIVRTMDDPEWKVLYAARDGKLTGSIQFDFTGISEWVSDPAKLASSIEILNNKENPNYKILMDLINKIRPGLQKQIDDYANKVNSNVMFKANEKNILGTHQKVDELVGGKSEGMTLKQIADKHKVTLEFIKEQFAAGVQVELEHTNDHEIAGDIARDHLTENPNYYIELNKAGLVDEKASLDELDIGNVLNRVKQMVGRKNVAPPEPELIEPTALPHPSLHDIEDNLPDQPKALSATRPANDVLDDNLPDQSALDPELNPDLWKKAVQYIQNPKDNSDPDTWEESCEEFEEDEILDERKFEKVKMARNMLSKLGYPKSYERNKEGKYILRSKHIRKLMTKLGYIFSDEKSRWIANAKDEPKPIEEPTPVDVSSPELVSQDTGTEELLPKNAIIWVGHIKNWGEEHNKVIEKGIESLDDVGANMLFIIPVKEDEDIDNFTQQTEVLLNLYKDNEKIDVSSIAVPTSSIVDIFAVASKQKIIVKGWLSGSEFIDDYKKQFESFKSNKYKEEFEQKTRPGTPYPFNSDIIFISTDATPSATESYLESFKSLKDSINDIFFKG